MQRRINFRFPALALTVAALAVTWAVGTAGPLYAQDTTPGPAPPPPATDAQTLRIPPARDTTIDNFFPGPRPARRRSCSFLRRGQHPRSRSASALH